MKNKIFSILFSVFFAALFISCPAAPPTEPMDSYLPYVVPSTVNGLTASNGYENEIRLSWNASSNATGYQVWMIDANNYGAASGTSSSSHSYSKLEQRGFNFYEQVSGTSCDIKNLDKGKAYIFSVVALRDLGEDVTSINNRLLYSDISDFVEGSTVGNISLSAVPTTKSIILYWDVPNIFSAIPSVPGAEEPLYDHEFTIKYREKGTNDWSMVESDEVGDVFSYPMSISEYSLKLDTTYEFQVSMAVEVGGEQISSVDSDILPVVTDSLFSIEPVLSVDVEQGVSIDSIAVSWKVPSIPTGIDSKNVFKIERAVDDGSDPSSLEWTTLISPADFDALSIEASGGVYSWKDDTALDNTKYYYRITNGYKQSEGVYIMQDSSDPVTTSSSSGWKIWRPDVAKVVFTKGADGNSGTLSFSWEYPYEADERISWSIEENVWNSNDGKTESNSIDDLIAIWDEDLKVYKASPHTIKAEEGVVKVYSYKLSFMVDGEIVSVLNMASDDNITLGSSSGTVLISNLSATTNYVGVVQLSWKVDSSITGLDASSYTIYEDDEIKDIEGLAISGEDVEKSISLPAVGVHSYRIAVTFTESGAQNTYYCPDIVTGAVLNVPEAPSATDGTYKDGIKISWIVPAEPVVYELYYKAETAGDDDWKMLNDDDNDGSVVLPKAGDASDGQLFEFKLRAYNNNQSTDESRLYTDYSSIEQGNVFGAGAMTVSASYGENPEAITISWTPAIGADYYEIYRDSVRLPGQHKGTSYSDSSVSKLSPDVSNPIPLSKEYVYTVVPVSNSLGPVDKSYCKTDVGKLFAPPADIVASKGLYTDKINITWSETVNAAYYMLQKYKIADSGEYIAVGDPIRVNGTSYDDTVSTESVYYSVQAVNSNGVASLYQNGFSSSVDLYGNTEASNIGYRLLSVSTFIVEEQRDGEGRLKPYVKLTWSKVKGAVSYSISVEGGQTDIPIDTLSYSLDQITTNGLTADSEGYLAYDPVTEQYTYNDSTGLLQTSSVIEKYSIYASSTEQNSAPADRIVNVQRRLKPIELISISNTGVYEALSYINKQYDASWWHSEIEYNGVSGNVVSNGATGSSDLFKWLGHVEFNSYTAQNNVNYDTSANGKHMYYEIKSYTLGQSHALTHIGSSNGDNGIGVDSSARDCIILISVPNDGNSYSIQYKDVEISGYSSGEYIVTVNSELYSFSVSEVHSSYSISKPF